MCLICASIDKNQLTLNEAWRNLHEIYDTIEDDHVGEVLEKMMTLEMSSKEETEQYSIPFDEWDEWNSWGSD